MIGFYNYTVILTYLGVSAALVGMCFALNGSPSSAIVCLMLSGFCDLFDGSVAKTRKRTEQEKKFGVQIDSLADLVCFGALPAVIGFSLGLNRWFEIALLALYTLAALIRLAYYNVTEDELQFGQNAQRTHYDGMPVTTASLLIPLIYTLRPLMGNGFRFVYLGGLVFIAAAFLAKVRIKKLGVKGMAFAALLGAGVLVCLILGWSK